MSLGKLKRVKRRAVGGASGALVNIRPLNEDRPLPLLIEPAVDGLDLASWAADHKEQVEELLLKHAGILFRGFGISNVEEFQGVIRALYGQMLEYSDRVQPRNQVAGKVYTSTLYPPDQIIELHNESAYAANWALRILFYCEIPAAEGGETPVADCRRILDHLSPEVLRTFEEKELQYLRNMGDGFGISWQTSFQTEDREEAEVFAKRNGIEVEWKGGDRVRTRARRPAIVRHPKTGEKVWFNAAMSSHVSTLAPEAREALLSQYAEEDLPKHVFHGDGSPIDPALLDAIREAQRQETVAFLWQKGDVLLLDNMLASHGRLTYRGDRKVVVGMAEPVGIHDLPA